MGFPLPLTAQTRLFSRPGFGAGILKTPETGREGSGIRKSFVSDQRGLTLVELLVGVVILTILVVPLMRLFLTSAGTEVKARSLAKATSAAQSLTEQLQSLDMDLLLEDASLVSSSAAFYTKSGENYAYSGNAAPALPSGQSAYYIGLKNFLSGGQSYDAIISLDAASEINRQEVAVGNSMDLVLDLRDADGEALMALRAQAAGWVDDVNTLSADRLQRSISLTISKTQDEYQVLASFKYTASVQGTSEEKNGQTLSFSFTSEKSASHKPAFAEQTAPLFSAFLFYDAYYKPGLGNQTLTVTNNTGRDVNLFLVNTSEGAVSNQFRLNVNYQYQLFSSGSPQNSLVYTNLPKDKVIYNAKAQGGLSEPLSVSGYLVETQERNRKFAVSVHIFEPGANFSGDPILTFDSTKLGY